MNRCILTVLLALWPAQGYAQEKGKAERAGPRQPADAMLAAHRHIQVVLPQDRRYSRYLWVSALDPKMKMLTWQAVSGLCNAMSVRTLLAQPLLVLDDGSTKKFEEMEGLWGQLELIYVKTTDYSDHFHVVFDRLGDPSREPLFHVWQPYKAGRYTDGSTYPGGWEVYFAPWLIEPLGLPQEQKLHLMASNTYAKALVELSIETRSPTPIVEAANFVWQAAIQFDRGRNGYADFLGFKDLKEFDRIVGFDERASLRFALPQLEAIAKSGVATQARRIEVWQKVGGIYVRTKDQVGQRGQFNRNPISTQARDALLFDAFEIFAQLPNKFWAVGLFNSDGVRQDSAPDGVGHFKGTISNDGKIHLGLMVCAACHDKEPGNGGMKPFRGYFRNLYEEAGPLGQAAKKQKVTDAFAEEYLTPIDLENAQRDYTKAVFRATGLTPDKFALALYEVYHYWDRGVNKQRAAELFGVTDAELTRSLSATLLKFGILDNFSGNWLLKHPDELGIDQFVESYNLTQLAMRGLPYWTEDTKKRMVKYRSTR